MVDPNLITGLGVSGGTIALAIATFLMVRQSRSQSVAMKEQLVALKEQTLFLQSKEGPILAIENFKFIANEIQLNISNIGNGKAIESALTADFFPTRKTIISSSELGKPLGVKEIRKAITKKQDLFMREDPDIYAEIKFEGKKRYPAECMTFLVNNVNLPGMLNENKTESFSVEPWFLIKESKQYPSGKFAKFDELREILKNNDIHTIYVDFGLIAKDIVEKPIQDKRLASFYVDFDKHRSLEEAYNQSLAEGRTPYSLPLSPDEIMTKFRFMVGDTYRNARSSSKSIE